jgi:RNA polymerase sigma factor (sigma-70 family)
MSTPGSDRPSWIERLIEGDDLVVREFWQAYAPRLHGLAAAHLSQRVARREAPEDVVQSAMRTFWRRARDGQFELADSDGLWRLLSAIVLNKTRAKARFHGRQRRDFRHEEGSVGVAAPDGPLSAASEPDPAEVAQFADELERLLRDMDDEERRLIDLKLQGCANPEIARELRCSERTVRRLLHGVQARWRRILEESQAW